MIKVKMTELGSILLVFILCPILLMAQKAQTITNEADVPVYELPELLVSLKGKKIKNVKHWEKIRRPEIVKLFEEEVYGKVPGELKISRSRLAEEDNDALEGIAKRKQVVLTFLKDGKELNVDVLIYLPKGTGNFPLFLGYNFYGNHTISSDPAIRLTESWVHDNPAFGIVHNQITEQSRGVQDSRWPVEEIIKSGCGLATIYYGDVDPDRDNFDDGVHPFFYGKSQSEPADDEWGAIAAWAWGLSRALDYFETDKDIDATKVVVVGHSRLGKTALWAGATDQRFAAVISNNSGCGGAAISRRRFGETVARINTSFPHWFCNNFNKYNNQEGKLPVDQHMLLALIAPRPLYVASATEDLWADPRGEFLSAKFASPVYQIYGLEGLPANEMPAPDSPVSGIISYHIRTGKHDITGYDWKQYIAFAKKMLK
ncbi:MAG: hypothetical protein RBS73_01570 [Prolixibacteraceae bacterium]|jgi:hypothetical protein|nr:hypothetical protein [Prolixibacteraceae bacterium]